MIIDIQNVVFSQDGLVQFPEIIDHPLTNISIKDGSVVILIDSATGPINIRFSDVLRAKISGLGLTSYSGYISICGKNTGFEPSADMLQALEGESPADMRDWYGASLAECRNEIESGGAVLFHMEPLVSCVEMAIVAKHLVFEIPDD